MEEHAKLYAAEFVDQSSSVLAGNLSSPDLEASGFSLVPLHVRIDAIDDLSPCCFDSYAEYESELRKIKAKEKSLVVIAESDELVAVVNYKGEQTRWALKRDSGSLPVFESKNAAYALFGL